MITLQTLLAAAKPGDTITLPPGAYGDQTVRSLSFSPPVTVSGAGAVFRSLTLMACTGLRFSGLSVAFTPTAQTVDWSAAVTLDHCVDVQVTASKIVGGPAIVGVVETAPATDPKTGTVIGRPCGYGVNIQHCSRVTVADSDISQFCHGVNFNDLTDGEIVGNNIHDTRRTPLCGGQPNRVKIDRNHLHDAHPWRFAQTPVGDHGDLAAFWSNADQTVPSVLDFTNNRLDQTADAPVLGMWLQGTATAPFAGFNISGNTILLANLQGVMIKNSRDGRIADNLMVTAVVAGVDPKQRPTVIVNASCTGVAITGNRTSAPVSDISGGMNPKSSNSLLSGSVSV